MTELLVLEAEHAPSHYIRVRGEKRANLSGADLRGANLYGADLSGANLCEINLSRADLRRAGLYGADLRGADLRGADLRGADLRGADLRGADLRGADLRGADLYEADLRGADLRGAGIVRVSFSRWAMTVTVTDIFIGCERVPNDEHAETALAELAAKHEATDLLPQYLVVLKLAREIVGAGQSVEAGQ